MEKTVKKPSAKKPIKKKKPMPTSSIGYAYRRGNKLIITQEIEITDNNQK